MSCSSVAGYIVDLEGIERELEKQIDKGVEEASHKELVASKTVEWTGNREIAYCE